MMNFRLMITALAVAASCVSVATNSYRTDLLQQMANVMKITEQLDMLSNGEHYKLLTYRNRNITVIVKDSVIQHVGYAVFTPLQRQMAGAVVCNFLERYALEVSLPMKRGKSVERQLDEDGIFFKWNDFGFFKQLENDTTYCIAVENLDNRRYTVRWSKNEKEAFCVNFPIEHDLLAGTDMLENERRILDELQKTDSMLIWQDVLTDSTRLKMTWQGKYYVLPGKSYYIDQLNSNRYYGKNADNSYGLIYHQNYIVESLSNLLTTGCIENSYELEIRLLKYGFVQDTVTVKLNQWLNYCLKHHCTAYFGMISTAAEVANCELIMQNKEMGYIHLMNLTMDISAIEDRKGIITGRLSCYIPTTRIKYLFDELKL